MSKPKMRNAYACDMYTTEEAEKLKKQPQCEWCDNTITDAHYFDIDGTIICLQCLKQYCLRRTADYIE